MLYRAIFLFVVFLLFNFSCLVAQTWYDTAEERIDTLRKGDFTLHITDEFGDPVTDTIYVRLKKT